MPFPEIFLNFIFHLLVRSKAMRAKKVLQKKAALKEAKRAEALAAGFDYNSDDSDDESPVRNGKLWSYFN